MDAPSRRIPTRRDDRIILQFDYDCFYAQVFENQDPSLKDKPVGVKQKNILATCNYNARKQGARKLMLISEARRLCPNLVLVNGEDLTLFRDTSKILFNFLTSHSWNQKAERLGFDEVFMDVTDIIDYNVSYLNRNSLNNSFFHLSQNDPEQGFEFDASSVTGCFVGADIRREDDWDNPVYVRLLLGSHLAQYLRLEVETKFGYTSTCGISTNKVLSKLVGASHKPRNQTTLLALSADDVPRFMDGYTLRSVPGIGFKGASLLEAHLTGEQSEENNDSHTFESSLTVGAARKSPSVSPAFLENLLGGPGAEKGVGSRVWGLLHGVDPTDVKPASVVPSQISIEDTYKGLDTIPDIMEQLHKLSCSLVRRMRTDLLFEDDCADFAGDQQWLARPKTIRLSLRSWPESGQLRDQSYSRTSRSAPLPSFIFDLKHDIEASAERLVAEAVLPLFRRFQNEKGRKWNLQLINICVANMVPGAADEKAGVGRDIANMFKHQDEVLRPFRIISTGEIDQPEITRDLDLDEEVQDDLSWETTESSLCFECHRPIPSFAMPAHVRYHEMDG